MKFFVCKIFFVFLFDPQPPLLLCFAFSGTHLFIFLIYHFLDSLFVQFTVSDSVRLCDFLELLGFIAVRYSFFIEFF